MQKAEWSKMVIPQENGQVPKPAAADSAMLTSFIDAHGQRDAMIADVPNAFAQARSPAGGGKIEESGSENDGNERAIVKITGECWLTH